MFSSALQRAIDRGMKPGGDLVTELQTLGDYTIRSRRDAQAICSVLSRFPSEDDSHPVSSRLQALTGLFQQVASCEVDAFQVLYDEGLPQLIRIFDALADDPADAEADDLLFILKILAMYGSREGADRIVQAARKPLQPDAYLWHVVFSAFSQGHPQRDYVFGALSDPVPCGFIAVAMLDSANEAAIAGDLEEHPFDSPAGKSRMQAWLEDADPAHFSCAHSATAALPFISNPERDQLLAPAMDHADAEVQMEAAWASGKLGRESSLKVLVRYWRSSTVACWPGRRTANENLSGWSSTACETRPASMTTTWNVEW